MRKNPAIWVSLLGALLLLAVGFGLRISGAQIDLIMEVAVVLIPLIMGGAGAVIRSQVYTPDSVKLALKMPPESSIALLDRVIETKARVDPGDTHSEVVQKVVEATEKKKEAEDD